MEINMRKNDEYADKINPKSTEDLRSQVVRKETKDEDYPYNYEDSHHSTDVEKGAAKSPVRER